MLPEHWLLSKKLGYHAGFVSLLRQDNLGWPETHCVDQADLKFTEILLLLPGLKAYRPLCKLLVTMLTDTKLTI